MPSDLESDQEVFEKGRGFAKYKKKKIPKAVREALWMAFHPNAFKAKCETSWCPNEINAYNFQAGHNIPESRGGPNTIENLIPICARCNLSMGSSYTFDEWQKNSSEWDAVKKKRHWCHRYFCFL